MYYTYTVLVLSRCSSPFPGDLFKSPFSTTRDLINECHGCGQKEDYGPFLQPSIKNAGTASATFSIDHSLKITGDGISLFLRHLPAQILKQSPFLSGCLCWFQFLVLHLFSDVTQNNSYSPYTWETFKYGHKSAPMKNG